MKKIVATVFFAVAFSRGASDQASQLLLSREQLVLARNAIDKQREEQFQAMIRTARARDFLKISELEKPKTSKLTLSWQAMIAYYGDWTASMVLLEDKASRLSIALSYGDVDTAVDYLDDPELIDICVEQENSKLPASNALIEVLDLEKNDGGVFLEFNTHKKEIIKDQLEMLLSVVAVERPDSQVDSKDAVFEKKKVTAVGALWWALHKKRPEILQRILIHGTDPNASLFPFEKESCCPLQMAIRAGYQDSNCSEKMVDLLLYAGAQCNQTITNDFAQLTKEKPELLTKFNYFQDSIRSAVGHQALSIEPVIQEDTLAPEADEQEMSELVLLVQKSKRLKNGDENGSVFEYSIEEVDNQSLKTD